MFKKLQKSVIDKNKLLSTNLNKCRVNKTPSKIVFPNRTNLTFANIIVNMSSTSLSSIDNWNNSYFTTELYNNSFSSKSRNDIKNYRDSIHTKDNQSKLISMIINGIIGLKSNDNLMYCIKLIEIMVFLRDNIDKNNYIYLSKDINKDLLMIIYQTYFQMFSNDSIITILLKNDLKNNMKIFQNYHLMYIFYILTGIIYIHYNLKTSNKYFYTFLKQFIKNEKCNNSKCILCSQIDLIEKNILNYNTSNQSIFSQNPSVIKIVGKYIKNSNINNSVNNRNNDVYLNNNLNKVYHIKQKKNYNIINNSNDNIIKKKNIIIESLNNKEKSLNKNIYKENFEKKYNSHMVTTDRNNKKILDIKKYKNDIYDNNKKKFFYSQIIKANEKERNKFFNDSFSSKEKTNSKNKYLIQKQEKNILNNSYNYLNSNDKSDCNSNDKIYFTEINDNKNKRIIKGGEYNNLIDQIKIKLYNNDKPMKKNGTNFDNKNKLMDLIENNNINNTTNINSNFCNNTNNNKKFIQINKKELLGKNKKIKINVSTEVKNKNNKNHTNINIDKNNNIDKKEYIEINNNLNKASKVIKENINAIEQDIKNFKEHNNYIRQQLYYLTKKK